MKKMLINCSLLFLFLFGSVIAATENNLNVFLTQEELLHEPKKIKTLCSYDFCLDLKNATRLVQLKDYREKYLTYLEDNFKEDLINEVKTKGIFATKVIYE